MRADDGPYEAWRVYILEGPATFAEEGVEVLVQIVIPTDDLQGIVHAKRSAQKQACHRLSSVR